MIGFLSNEKYIKRDRIDYNKLSDNMKIISLKKDKYSRYISRIYLEYKDLIEESPRDIKDEIINELGASIITNKDIRKCKVIISPSHIESYHIIKELNDMKDDLLVICFDMHCDTYDYNDNLWKGNMFSKLIKEGYISEFMVLGVPKYKIKNTYLDVPLDIKDKVIIKKDLSFKKVLKKYKKVYISIDIDVLNARKAMYTSIDYSPHTVLEYVSKLNVNDLLSNNAEDIIKGCVLIKNDLGYDNLYRVGENKISIEKLCNKINEIKDYCKNNNIEFGLNGLYGDITEVVGNDYNFKTLGAIIKLLTVLGGGTNEKTIR